MKKYRIAGLLLGIDAKEQFLHKELQDFEVECEEKTDIQVGISVQQDKRDYPKKAVITAKLLQVYEEAERYVVRYEASDCVECYILEKGSRKAHIYLKSEKVVCHTEIMYSIRDSFFFYMQQLGRVAVHSASIVYQGKAWLFSAPAGTGKSTHVQLWKRNEYPVEDFNGDISACYMDNNGQAVAAGLPWCGTSGLYRNDTVPLGGILFLERSCHNEAYATKTMEGVLRLTARCLTPAWSEGQMDRNVNLAMELVKHCTMGVLYCTPQEQAAEVAKEFIDKILEINEKC